MIETKNARPHVAFQRRPSRLIGSPGNRLLSLIACSTVLLSSCKSTTPKIAIIPQTTATTLWEAEHAGAEAVARQHGIQIYWNAPTRGDDLQQQINLVENVIARHFRGLILAPDQPLALMVPIREALQQGIPTVIVGSSLPTPLDSRLSYIVNDDFATGQIAARRIGTLLANKGHVAVLGIDPNSPGSLAILHAFETTLEREFPNITLVDRRAGSSNESEAQQAADESIAKNPDLQAIFTLTAIATRGAYLSLQARGLTSKIKVVGFEQDLELMSLVRERQIDALIAENTYQMGYQAMDLLAHQQTTGQPGKQIKLAPILLTADNADSPAAQTVISMDWSTIR